MIHVQVHNEKQQHELEHQGSALEFGRGPQRMLPRIVVDDVFCSRDQLRIEELPDGRLRLDNLSSKNAVTLSTGAVVAVGTHSEVDLPVCLSLGKTVVDIGKVRPGAADGSSMQTVHHPVLYERDQPTVLALHALGETPAPEKLTHWLESIIALQRSAEGGKDFFGQTAKTLVELIGLDLGMVLLRRGERWEIAAHAMTDPNSSLHYSRTLLGNVVAQRQTFYQDLGNLTEQTMSLADVAAVVVSPVFGLRDEVVGVLYGQRNRRGLAKVGPIRPLEAQVVQLLAAAVGANLARAEATRTRIQFEQFFSPELARELERDPHLLEGREQEVTVLVSDLRGFSSLAERLGANNTCRLVRDMMERMSDRIVAQGGVIVDYAGDGILAMWNAPAPQADHAVRACTAALDMLAEMSGLNETWRETVGGSLRLGVGLNTGPAQVGNTGSSRKFKYGPHGHTVNVASRVQDATKRFGLPVLVTESTRRLLADAFALRRIGKTHLPGIECPVALFELHDHETSPEWETQRSIYEQSLDFFEKGQWGPALQELMKLPGWTGTQEHRDTPSLKLMKRAVGCLESPPEKFDAVIE